MPLTPSLPLHIPDPWPGLSPSISGPTITSGESKSTLYEWLLASQFPLLLNSCHLFLSHILPTVTPRASSSPNIYVQISGVSLSYPRPQLAYSVTTTAPPGNCSATNSFTFSQSTSPCLSTVPSLPKDQHLNNLHASVLTSSTLHPHIILAWINSVPALSAPGPA